MRSDWKFGYGTTFLSLGASTLLGAVVAAIVSISGKMIVAVALGVAVTVIGTAFLSMAHIEDATVKLASHRRGRRRSLLWRRVAAIGLSFCALLFFMGWMSRPHGAGVAVSKLPPTNSPALIAAVEPNLGLPEKFRPRPSETERLTTGARFVAATQSNVIPVSANDESGEKSAVPAPVAASVLQPSPVSPPATVQASTIAPEQEKQPSSRPESAPPVRESSRAAVVEAACVEKSDKAHWTRQSIDERCLTSSSTTNSQTVTMTPSKEHPILMSDVMKGDDLDFSDCPACTVTTATKSKTELHKTDKVLIVSPSIVNQLTGYGSPKVVDAQ
jgi:hypothetical protein